MNCMLKLHEKFNIGWNNDTINKSIVILKIE